MSKKHKKENKHPERKISTEIKKPQEKKNLNFWILLAAILGVVFFVFTPILDNKLTNWDDDTYLVDNPLIRHLDWLHIKRIFSEYYFGNYQPIHIFSYAVEYHFFGLNPEGYHAVSLVMHLIVTVLVFWFINVLCNNRVIAIITALLFGLHPLHVESVAWAAERKDLLYATFFILAMIFYLKYIDTGEKMKFFIITLLFFILSIFSKAMASSLPPVLILLDYFRARKFSMKLVWEKIPFFAIAVIMGLVSINAAESTHTISHDNDSLLNRIFYACHNLLAYLGKLILPLNLSSFYPYPVKTGDPLPFNYYVAPFVVVALFILILRSMKTTRSIFFASGFFVACIFLVLQLLPVGPTIMSERYTYLPSITFCYLIGLGVNSLIEKRKNLEMPLYGLICAYSIFLGAATYKRCDVWQNSITLWDNVLKQFPRVPIALNNRGNVYGKEMGQLDIALENFNKSIEVDPTYEKAYTNRGLVYCMKGKFDLGIQDFNTALKLNPNDFEALQNRGIAFAQTGRLDTAIADFSALIKIQPGKSQNFVNRGMAYIQSGKFDTALVDLNQAVYLDKDNAEAYYRRAVAYYNLKKYQEAYQDVQLSVSLGYKGDETFMAQVREGAGIKQ